MENRWSEAEAAKFVEEHAPKCGEDLAVRTYSARLLGGDPALVLHGGGNTSVKSAFTNILDERVAGIFVKASGADLATIGCDGHPGLDLDRLRKLRALERISDREMDREIRACLFDPNAANPSIETLVHAFLPHKFIDHTHAGAILALTNQSGGENLIREALGSRVAVLRYVTPGFDLAKAAAAMSESESRAIGMVWMKHGIVSWGETARESYDRMIELVNRAEGYLASHAGRSPAALALTSLSEAETRWTSVAPIVRGALAAPSGDPDRPHHRAILSPCISRESLAFMESDRGEELALTAPLTSDHLIRTKAAPLWIDAPDYGELGRLHDQIRQAVTAYAAHYAEYLSRHSALLPEGVQPFDSMPRVVLLPGLGVVAAGRSADAAAIARDIAAHTLVVKSQVAAMNGTYEGLPEAELFEMEYRTQQHAKLHHVPSGQLDGEVALVTGAAGAIGSAIADALLEAGCHVAVTDLAGEALESLATDLRQRYGRRVIATPLDVTSADSVQAGFGVVSRTWGGVDLAVVNAGAAAVSPLDELSLEAFRKLERINVEGALLVLSEAARIFKLQRTGGDIVLISTKNVFSPGARFGAYSATKAAAHQLARIASLELAEYDVRVNMVAPDAVFSHGARRSGLWAQVGPDRMKARGLTEEQLEEYYKNRNLLKARVTARHVARAVLFLARRETPTTGATIPVDGGLPDATPR